MRYFVFSVIFGLLLLTADYSYAAIAFDAAASGRGAVNASKATTTMTVGAGLSNSVLICQATSNDGNQANGVANSVTYGGTNLTKINNSTGTVDIVVSTWYLLNPVSGANMVTSTFAGALNFSTVGCMSFSGVDQTTPVEATSTNRATSATPTSTVTTITANAWVTGVVSGEAAITAPNTDVRYGPITGQSFQNVEGNSTSSVVTPGNVNFKWTLGSSQPWVVQTAVLKPATAAPVVGGGGVRKLKGRGISR